MRAVIAVLLAAVCFGTTGTAQELAAADASPLAVGAARILIGGGLLALWAWAVRQRSVSSRSVIHPARGGSGLAAGVVGQVRVTASRRRSAGLVLVGSLGVLAYQPAFFLGTATNGVAVGTVIALGSAPVLTGAIDAVIRRRRPSVRWMTATALAVAGVALVAGVLEPTASAADPVGLMASVGAGAAYAAYTLASKALLDLGWQPSDAMGALFGVAGVVSLPVLFFAGAEWLFTTQGIALALWLGVITTAVAYALFGWALATLAAPTVATLTLAEPLTATILGVALLGEQLSGPAVVGMVVLVMGLVLISVAPLRRVSRNAIVS